MDARELRPRRWWYALAVVVLVVSLVGGVGLIVVTVATAATIERFAVPGGTTLDLEAGDERTVYGDATSGSPRDLTCELTAPGGGPENVPSTLPLSLTVNDEAYVAALAFTAENSGPHELTCASDAVSQAAVGPTVGVGGLFARIGGALALLFGGGLLAIVVFLVTIIRRSTHKRRLQTTT